MYKISNKEYIINIVEMTNLSLLYYTRIEIKSEIVLYTDILEI